MTTVPTFFLSYSWDDPTHSTWVRQLATDLMKNGVYVYLDQWDIQPGMDLARFMEFLRRSDWIGVVCTPKYGQKSATRTGGVGYESQLMTRQIVDNMSTTERVLPLLRSGEARESIPPEPPREFRRLIAVSHAAMADSVSRR